MRFVISDYNSFIALVLFLIWIFLRGLAAAELVLNTMRAAQLNESNDTRFSILRGILRRSNFNEFQVSLQKYGFKLEEYQLLDIITELGLNNMKWLSSVSRKLII